MTTTLSTVKPDFDSIKDQLITFLQQKDSWSDILTTSTGTSLIEFIAAAGAFSQFSIESALQETSLDTAKLDSSVYSIARMLGVRLMRKRPTAMTTTLNRVTTDTITIPAYTQFKCGAVNLFNKTAITFNSGVTTLPGTTLYEGTVKTVATKGSGDVFQTFISADDGFKISNEDVIVSVDGTGIPVTMDGLWHFKDKAPAVQDATTKTGALSLMFGNDYFAFKPLYNSAISITYVITAGLAGTSYLTSGQAVSCPAKPEVTGNAATSLTGGGDENPSSTYRRISPILFASGDRSVTENEYNALALTYPGVIDCQVVGQRKLSPTRLEYMNLVRLSLLTATTWTTPEFQAFVDWYAQKTMYAVRFYRQDPIARDFVVTGRLYCNNRAYDLGAIQNKAQAALEDFLTAKQGFIGLNLFRSDIYSVLMAADSSIEYVELDLPTTDVVSNVAIPVITTAVQGAGTLAANTYAYKITAINALDETLPSNPINCTITVTHGVVLTWAAVPNATGYKIYGRFNEFKYIATTASTTYTDSGSITPTGSSPDLDTTGSFYPRCTAINLNSFMTARNI